MFGVRPLMAGWGRLRDPDPVTAHGVVVAMDGIVYNGGGTNWFAERYGRIGFEETVRQANGDFAVALYDPAEDVLWLARDRFGVRPLYYVSDEKRFAFASQPRALLALPGVSSEPEPLFVALFAASHYRTFDNAPEESPYRNISQLPAAHLMRVTADGIQKRRYWTLEDLPDFTEPEAELAERYRELFMDAVALRLKAAQKPVFTLSGGMDSSSVLACAVRGTGRKQHAASTVYTDATYDESAEIGSMLESTVEQWHPVRVDRPDVLPLIEEMIALHDEPVATATWLSHYLLCRELKALGFESVFGGLGGDELNAGEYEYFTFHFADLQAAGQEKALQSETERWIAHHDHPIYRKSVAGMREALTRLVDPAHPGRCRPDWRRLRRYASALNPDYFDLQDFSPVMEHPFRSYLKNRTYQDLTRETIPCCLRAEDRQTAAFGLDHFLPFFDHRLVEFMFRIPGTLKIRGGVTKILLREAMRGILPEETRTRIKKTGWNAPAHVWFSGPGRETLHDLVGSRAFRERGIYDVPKVRELIDEHDAIVSSGLPRENHMMFLWQLVNLELWLRRGSKG